MSETVSFIGPGFTRTGHGGTGMALVAWWARAAPATPLPSWLTTSGVGPNGEVSSFLLQAGERFLVTANLVTRAQLEGHVAGRTVQFEHYLMYLGPNRDLYGVGAPSPDERAAGTTRDIILAANATYDHWQHSSLSMLVKGNDNNGLLALATMRDDAALAYADVLTHAQSAPIGTTTQLAAALDITHLDGPPPPPPLGAVSPGERRFGRR